MTTPLDDAPEEWNPPIATGLSCAASPERAWVGGATHGCDGCWRAISPLASTTPHTDAACAESTPHGGAGMPCA